MRLPALFGTFVALVALTARDACADTGDVVVQAGHEGRPQSCAPLHVKACNLGTAAQGVTEREWTAAVADETTRIVREAGYTVVRRPADYADRDTARIAVFLHFDGATPCASGASVGFPDTTSRSFIDAWETSYRAWFPYRFVGENFTKNEHEYYGFRKADAPQKMLIEFGEMTCPAQFAWMQPRLRELAQRLGAFLIAQLPPAPRP